MKDKPPVLPARLKRKSSDKRDVKIIKANAKRLNAEAQDVLKYQRVPWRPASPHTRTT